MKPDDNCKFDNLCSHYRDTIEIHKRSIKSRELFFFISIILSSFFLASDNTISSVIRDLAKENVGVNINFTPKVFVTLLWFFACAISVRYFQINVNIEKEYDYMHSLEKEINSVYGGKSIAFSREGSSYLKGYPAFKNWLHLFYTWFFPIFIILCPLINLRKNHVNSDYNLLHIISFVFLLVSTCLYLVSLKCKRKNKNHPTKSK